MRSAIEVEEEVELPDTLTVAEVASVLRVSSMTIRNMCDANAIPHKRVTSRCIRFSRKALAVKFPEFFGTSKKE